jgi:hypothetical protein
MFSWIHPYILQSISQFAIKSNPTDVVGFIVTFAFLIVLIVFMNVSKRIKSSAIFNGRGVEIKTGTGLKLDRTFYGKVRYLDLSKKEAAILEKILKSDGGNPYANLLNSVKVDENFRLAYRKIVREKRMDEAQADLLELFSIRNTVEMGLLTEKKGTGKKLIRNFRRKNTNINCKIYLVIVNDSKSQKKLVLQHDPMYPGIIQNISQGGCAMIAAGIFKINSMIKIDFNIGKQSDAALGQIIRINKETRNFIYHIKFLKLSKQTILDINTFIFEYN